MPTADNREAIFTMYIPGMSHVLVLLISIYVVCCLFIQKLLMSVSMCFINWSTSQLAC